MRSYPRNSNEAAARIIAIAMICDGHLCKREIDALHESCARLDLAIGPAQWHDVVQGVCEDLLVGADMHWDRACRIDAATLDALLAEIDDPGLARKVIAACERSIGADLVRTESEAWILARAARAWGIEREPAHA